MFTGKTLAVQPASAGGSRTSTFRSHGDGSFARYRLGQTENLDFYGVKLFSLLTPRAHGALGMAFPLQDYKTQPPVFPSSGSTVSFAEFPSLVHLERILARELGRVQPLSPRRPPHGCSPSPRLVLCPSQRAPPPSSPKLLRVPWTSGAAVVHPFMSHIEGVLLLAQPPRTPSSPRCSPRGEAAQGKPHTACPTSARPLPVSPMGTWPCVTNTRHSKCVRLFTVAANEDTPSLRPGIGKVQIGLCPSGRGAGGGGDTRPLAGGGTRPLAAGGGTRPLAGGWTQPLAAGRTWPLAGVGTRPWYSQVTPDALPLLFFLCTQTQV